MPRRVTAETAREPAFVTVRGAREHNLKGVDLSIPKKRLVVFTGVSGSGKSTMAFDTLFAEGQRRYVESLSSYARQFLGQMEKPRVDSIRGLSPTIAIEQKTASNNPRSTVGTVTEVHDHLRVLFANIGKQHCHLCGRLAEAQDRGQIARVVSALPPGTRATLLAPLVRQRKGEHKDVFAAARERGFSRARIDRRIVDLSAEMPTLDKKAKHDIELVVDRVVVKPDAVDRIADSIETALTESGGTVLVETDGNERFFSEKRACVACGVSFDEIGPLSFSFNSPLGFCPECNGLGSRPEMDPELVVTNGELSIREGAVLPWAAAAARGSGFTAAEIEWVARAFGIDLDKPWKRLSEKQKNAVLFGGTRHGTSWEGVCNQLMRRMRATESEEMRQYYMRFFSQKTCSACEGTRLRPESRAVKVSGKGICDVSAVTILEAAAWVDSLELRGADAAIAVELLKEIGARLGFLRNVGLGYLTLDRTSATLSGGESQRIRLASQIGSDLSGVMYVLDEPSIGLHQRDNRRLLDTLVRLRDLGNTVLVVEHDEETIREADHVVDFGIGAGEEGGRVVAEGTPEAIEKSATSLTGAYLSRKVRITLPSRRREPDGRELLVHGAREHNLQDVTVGVPLGLFVCVTGVSGAGKSTLVNGVLLPSLERTLMGAHAEVGAHEGIDGIEHLDKVIAIDQRPIGRTPRSNPATYTKVFDAIRTLFASTKEAKSFGYDAGRFSFNVKGGRCEACGGDGIRRVEMHFLPDVHVTCDTCKGKRFNDATLRVTYKGKNIADTLSMSVREALAHFSVHREIVRGLSTLDEVGLGYLQLGQSSPTLSGGEAQRIKLARELSRPGTGRTLYVLDEPTTGLHFADVQRLLYVLDRLVGAGNTVLVIEHNLDVIKCADWIIDMGPEGGREGGRIVAQGAPERVARAKGSHTGRYLREVLESDAGRAKRVERGGRDRLVRASM